MLAAENKFNIGKLLNRIIKDVIPSNKNSRRLSNYLDCDQIYIRNLETRTKEPFRNGRYKQVDKSAVVDHFWTYIHDIANETKLLKATNNPRKLAIWEKIFNLKNKHHVMNFDISPMDFLFCCILQPSEVTSSPASISRSPAEGNVICIVDNMKTAIEGLEITLHKGLQIIRLNRPHKKNAITSQMYEGITNALNEAAVDDNVVITALTGTGDYYSSGNDISSYTSFNAEDMHQGIKMSSNRLRNFVSAFINFPKMLVAVVNGPAIGIAATTLGLCDVVYASDQAKFLTPFTKLGLVAEGCSSYTFPRIMGKSKASEMLYFGYEMPAEEAKQCGLVSEVYPSITFSTQVWPKLEKLARLPIKSMIYSKQLVCHWERDELHRTNARECERLEERWQSEECLDAIVGFLTKQSKM